MKDRSLLARDFKQGQLLRGPQEPEPPGPVGTIEGVAAGGDLGGTYPSPEIGADVVTGAEVRDGSLLLTDMTVLSRQFRVNPLPVRAHSCLASSAPAPGLRPYDRTLVLPTQNLPPGLFVKQVLNTNLAGRVLFRLCNATAKALDPPLGAWAYVAWR